MRLMVMASAGVLAASVLTGWGTRAAADDLENLLRRGVELRRQGKTQDALETFQRAAAIRETPRVMAQVGLAEQELGLWARAETHLKSALDGESDPWIQKNRRALDEAFKTIERHLGSLEIVGSPAGAEVTIDGQPSGKLPSSGVLRMPIGEVKVSVRKDGYADVTRVVEIMRGELVRESVDLHALPPPPTPPPPLPATAGALAASGPSEGGGGALTVRRANDEPTGHGADERAPLYTRWWFWTLVGAVAIGAGAGAYFITHRPTVDSMTCDAMTPCNHI
jgi:hypothetical protein